MPTPAPLWRRFIAFAIDLLAIVVTLIILAMGLAIVITVVGGGDVAASYGPRVLFGLLWLGYYLRGHWRRGGTLGEQAMKIAVLPMDGTGLSPGLVAVRAILMVLLFWTWPLAAFSPARQTPYDRLLGIRVVLRQQSHQG